MWTCPKCQHRFYNKNQSHSCLRVSVEDFLSGKPQSMKLLFRYFLDAYGEIGPFEIHPVKSRVALLVKMRFCSINRIGKDFISVHFVLTEPYEDNSCFYKIENLANRFFVHHARLETESDVNAELKKYMRMAYKVGNREHVK